jgi:hypothetical protein
MKRLLLRAFLTTLAALAFSLSVRADPVPVWDYVSTPLTPTLTSGLSSITMQGDSLSGIGQNSTTSSSSIVLANLYAVSSNTSSTDSFSSANWKVQLSITDETAHSTQSLTFSGFFNGTMSAGSSNFSAANNTLPGGQSLTFGNITYQVNLTSFVAPSLPGSMNPGGIGAFVTVTVGNLGGGTSAGVAPEPSALVLGGLGSLSFLMGWRQRRRRRARRAATTL